MNLNDIISAKLTAYDDAENLSKRKTLERITQLVCEFNQDIKPVDLLEALQHRERLGSTAIGNGIAIPHARVEGLQKPMCVVLLLRQPVDFDSDIPETTQVDLIFCLLVPVKKNDIHLLALSELTKKLKNDSFINQLRASQSSEALYQTVVTSL